MGLAGLDAFTDAMLSSSSFYVRSVGGVVDLQERLSETVGAGIRRSAMGDEPINCFQRIVKVVA